MTIRMIYHYVNHDNSFGVGYMSSKYKDLLLSFEEIKQAEEDIKKDKGYKGVIVTDWKEVRD